MSWLRKIEGTIFFSAGALLIAFVFFASRSLSLLLENEGTESFAAGVGGGGTFGCYAFLALVAVGGMLLLFVGFHRMSNP